MSIVRPAALILPVAIGAVALVALIRSRPAPGKHPAEELPRHVRVVEAEIRRVAPEARGFGPAMPGRTWEAVAEVSGQVATIDSRLEPGALVPPGAVLVALDPEPYEIARAQAQASLTAIEAQLRQLERSATHTERLLAIERDALAVARDELERAQRLESSGASARAQVDQAQRSVLAQRRAVASLENTLDMLPAERELLRANLEGAQSGLDRALLNLRRCTFTAPFFARVADVRVERTQFVGAGTRLLSAHAIDAAEVVAQLPTHAFAELAGESRELPDLSSFLQRGDNLGEVLQIDAEVHALGGVWPARLVRTRPGLDPATRTVGVVVVVDQPYRDARLPDRPPLVPDTYCTVVLRGRRPTPHVVIPAAAVREGSVFVIDDDQRLARRAVEVAFTRGRFVALRGGVEAGARVLVSDPIPPAEGMLLAGQPDVELTEALRALGEAGQ